MPHSTRKKRYSFKFSSAQNEPNNVPSELIINTVVQFSAALCVFRELPKPLNQYIVN